MPPKAPNYIWRKDVSPSWLTEREAILNQLSGGQLALIERARRKRLRLEVNADATTARTLLKRFGGTVEKLSANWLKQFLQTKATKPIRIGSRLLICNAPQRSGSNLASIVIPAGAAFGTGEHATTAMSLRILERISRRMTPGWRMLDAGTGSGILALAGRVFGAGEVVAVDNDPMAIRTAKSNARENRLRGIQFICGDINKNINSRFDLITANLYSELLVVVLPRFRRHLSDDGKLILSGILRDQERRLTIALRSHGFRIKETRRRGKWIALQVESSPKT